MPPIRFVGTGCAVHKKWLNSSGLALKSTSHFTPPVGCGEKRLSLPEPGEETEFLKKLGFWVARPNSRKPLPLPPIRAILTGPHLLSIPPPYLLNISGSRSNALRWNATGRSGVPRRRAPKKPLPRRAWERDRPSIPALAVGPRLRYPRPACGIMHPSPLDSQSNKPISKRTNYLRRKHP